MTYITISIAPAADTWSFTTVAMTGTITGGNAEPGRPQRFMIMMTGPACPATQAFLQRNGEIA
jgi:hypothetical protein